MGSAAEEATPLLRRALRSRKFAVRFAAARALADIGGPSEEALPVYREALERGGEDAWQAAALLGELGPRARGAVPALKLALRDRRYRLRRRAEEALRSISPEETRLRKADR
jgi:HEAT repeat protein